MDLFESSKQFLEEYYPRDHLLIAGVLSLIILIFLAIPNDGDIRNPPLLVLEYRFQYPQLYKRVINCLALKYPSLNISQVLNPDQQVAIHGKLMS